MNNTSDFILNLVEQINDKLFDATPYFILNIDEFSKPCPLFVEPIIFHYSNNYPNKHTRIYLDYLKNESDKIIDYIIENSNNYNKKDLITELNILHEQLNTTIKVNMTIFNADIERYKNTDLFDNYIEFHKTFTLYSPYDSLIDTVDNLLRIHYVEYCIKDCIEYYLKPQLKEVISKINSENLNTNKHENIFCNNGFELFEYLLENFVKPKNQRGHHKDVLFCYHKLYNENKAPNYIHQRTQTFLDWYNPLYKDNISQTKTYKEVKNSTREKNYTIVLNQFKQQKKLVP